MNRRDFLSRLGGAGAMTAGTLAIASAPLLVGPPTSADLLDYGFYELRWTGWKPAMDSPIFVAQWLAWPKFRDHLAQYPLDQRYFYACAPLGGLGSYRPGQQFYTAIKDGREVVTEITPPALRDHYRAESLGALKFLVDRDGIRVLDLATPRA